MCIVDAACFIYSSGLLLHQSLEFLWGNSCPLGKSCLYWHYSIVLLLSAKALSCCSCHVLVVETGRSNSCLNCSLTGRRCWEDQTVTTLSLLHCTAFAFLALCPLSSPLSLLSVTFLFSGPWLWQKGSLSYGLKTVALEKSQPMSYSSWHTVSVRN